MSAASGRPARNSQLASASGIRVDCSSVVVPWSVNDPPVSFSVVNRVPGGSQEASVRKPVLFCVAERPSVMTGCLGVQPVVYAEQRVVEEAVEERLPVVGALGDAWPACTCRAA